MWAGKSRNGRAAGDRRQRLASLAGPARPIGTVLLNPPTRRLATRQVPRRYDLRVVGVGSHRHAALSGWPLLIALVAGIVAGCGATTPTTADTLPVKGSAAVEGTGDVTVSGAVSFKMTHLATCRTSRTSFEVLFEAVVTSNLYLLEISADNVSSPGNLMIGKDSPLTATLSTNGGLTWDGATAGSSGRVTPNATLSRGTLDLKLTSVTDGSTIHAVGTWTCG